MRALSANERRVIELVATRGGLARTDLARETGLTGASVTRIVGELARLGIFDEAPQKDGTTGQPKRLLSLRAGRYYSAGLTFSRRTAELAVLDLAGTIVGQRRIRSEDGSIAGIARAARAALEAMAADAVPWDRLVGLGCAVPGNFGDSGQALRAHGTFAELDRPETLDAMAEALGLPVTFENDGTSAAIGEHVYGRQPSDGPALVFIHIGHGIGGGAVIDGVPFRGVHGNACLPGFLYPYGAPRPSGQDLLETLADAGLPVTDFDDLAALDPAPPALAAWTARAGAQLTEAVRAVSALFDPSVIVVGGRLPSALAARLVAAMGPAAIPGPSRGLRVAPVRAASLGPQGGAVGAACLPLFRTFFGGGLAGAGGRRAEA